MAAASRSPISSDWRDIASLGEQIVNATSIVAQRDYIVAMTSRMVTGEVDVWLDEKIFRLPNIEEKKVFPDEPEAAGMQRALKAGQVCTRQQRTRDGKSSTSRTARRHAQRAAWAAVPLIEQGMTLGALQVTRKEGPEFKQRELDLLERLAGAVAVSLIASHRVAVERFRLNQLNLVREVSAQIANVLNVDQLASHVTELIQQTFHYYYVAIFTLQEGSSSLRFRSSASAPRKGKRKATQTLASGEAVALQVEIGQGLIGQAAAEGERIIVDDAKHDPRFRFIDSLPETCSEVVLPLKIEDRVLGVLDVQSDQPHAFHPNDL
ncbi:MAG TPA: GAF domain-containing protein, partial [Anaerolineales bacterium]|nr:GAF domain-containing protein [Anaerolineales bacterium]